MATKDESLGNQMEELMAIMMGGKQSKKDGEKDIDTAVHQILKGIGAKPPPPPPSSTSATKPNSTASIDNKTNSESRHASNDIVEDTQNYDDDEEDDNITDVNNAKPSSNAATQHNPPSATMTSPPARNNKRKSDRTEGHLSSVPEDAVADQVNHSTELPQYEDYEAIPLGKQGAQMMTTFGDGPRPNLDAVEAALMGTRKCLQIAIIDARALRRSEKKNFLNARSTLADRNTKAISANSVDAKMLYNVVSGQNKLAYDPKCGFDVEQLQKLFPEEMRAYFRWVDMHDAYEENTQEEAEKVAEKVDENSTKLDSVDDSDIALPEGHLQERAAQFDVRTEQMKSDWYIKFSKVRQGSFISRRALGLRKSKPDMEWDRRKKMKSGQGKQSGGIWESMSAGSVRFLHWLGFDPPELPPPNEDTTQALAFLGYDLMGKIVEKAIFLRNMQRARTLNGDANMLSEMRPGEQIELKDIQTSMEDPDIRPTSLYGNGEKKQKQPHVATQLYFGPGFEERLEAEIDAMVSTSTRDQLTMEEKKNRDEDANLLARMEERPTLVDSLGAVVNSIRDKLT